MKRGALALAVVLAPAIAAPAGEPGPPARAGGRRPQADGRAPFELELVLPRAGVLSPPEGVLAHLASSGLVPEGAVREARRKERPRLFARFGPADLPLVPEARRVLEAAGLREVTLQLYTDGDLLRAVASVRIGPGAPAPPLVNASLSPPALGENGWASAAVSLDAARLVPWMCDVAARADEFRGQVLRDALVVAKWNLGIDVEKDIAGSFAGTVRALAVRRGGGSAALAADVRSPEPLAKALVALSTVSLGSQLLGGPGLEPARFGGADGYRARTPWPALAPALVLRDGALAASTRPELLEAGPGALVRRLSASFTEPAGSADGRPCALAAIGTGEACAAGVVDVLECVRAAREAARAAGLDPAAVPEPATLAWADGEAAVAVRVGGEGLQAWGAWVPARPALGAPPDGAVASAGP